MKFFKISAIALAVLAAPLAGAASAKTLSYDFTGQGQTASSFDFTSEGVDLTVAGYYNLGGKLQDTKMTRWSQGIGISSGWFDDHQIDGSGLEEYLSFSFSEEIDRLETLTFDFVDRKDSFDIFSLNGNKLNKIYDSKISKTETGEVTFAFAEGINFGGSVLFLGATGTHDNFKLRGLTASIADVAPVPLPAGGLLLVSGLFGVGVARRLRKKAA